MRLYVASSWRNWRHPNVIDVLREVGHEVYDFRHPPGGDHLGFHWSDVDPNWSEWTPSQYVAALEHPVAQAGFESDFGAMLWADGCVLVLPCNRSAHLEAGWMIGQGKPTWVLLDRTEPGWKEGGVRHEVAELMYKMATGITTDILELDQLIKPHEGVATARRVLQGVDMLLQS